MQIKFKLTENDYIEFNLFHLRTSKSMQKSILNYRMLLPLLLALMLAYQYVSSDQFTSIKLIVSITIYSIVGIVWFLLYPTSVEAQHKKNVRKMLSEGNNKSLIGEKELIFGELELIEVTEFKSESTKWDSVVRIEKTEKYVFIYTSSITAQIIPNSAFENNEVRTKCFELLKNRIDKEAFIGEWQ